MARHLPKYLTDRGHRVTAYLDGTLETSEPISGEEMLYIRENFRLTTEEKKTDDEGRVCR